MPFNEGLTTTLSTASSNDSLTMVAANVNLRLLSYSILETTNAAALVVLRHGTTLADPPLAYEAIAASGSKVFAFPPPGLPCPNGICLDRVSGKTEVCTHTTTGS